MREAKPRKANYLLKCHILAEAGIQACIFLNLEPTVLIYYITLLCAAHIPNIYILWFTTLIITLYKGSGQCSELLGGRWQRNFSREQSILDTSSRTTPICSRNFLLHISDSSSSPTSQQYLLSRSCNLDLTGAGTWQTGEEQRGRGSCFWTRVRSEQRPRDRLVIRMGTPRTWGV